MGRIWGRSPTKQTPPLFSDSYVQFPPSSYLCLCRTVCFVPVSIVSSNGEWQDAMVVYKKFPIMVCKKFSSMDVQDGLVLIGIC